MSDSELTVPTFRFAPAAHAEAFARDGYVHIPGGVDPAFLRYAVAGWEAGAALPGFAFAGKKQQRLFDFPERGDWPDGVKDAVAAVTGLDRARLTLCERHVKAYDPNAAEQPPAHKDRVASEVAVGIPLVVAPGSTVLLYPDDELTINPFESTALWRSSLDDDRLPEVVLRGKRCVELDLQPGDCLVFRGSSIYHERSRPAGTVVLYLKFNAMRLDPLGEDPSTAVARARSLELLASCSDEALLDLPVDVSPRLLQVSRHYTRLYWQEVIQAYVGGQRELTLSEQELAALRLADGRRTVREVIRRLGVPEPHLCDHAAMVRRLVARHALDLLDPSP